LTAWPLVEVLTRKSRQLKQSKVKITYSVLMAINVLVSQEML